MHGDAVNLAARLESLNKDYGTSILVSEATARALSDSPLTFVVDVPVRGLGSPVKVFSLDTAVDAHSS